jgi:hypothetical protein
LTHATIERELSYLYYNGQTTERIAHTVVNIDDRAAGEKILSLTYKQSQPVEEAMEQGYTVMDIIKVGEGFSLSYDIKPIELFLDSQLIVTI